MDYNMPYPVKVDNNDLKKMPFTPQGANGNANCGDAHENNKK